MNRLSLTLCTGTLKRMVKMTKEALKFEFKEKQWICIQIKARNIQSIIKQKQKKF